MADPKPRPARPWQAWTLAGVELFVAYQAFTGGVGLIDNTWQLPTQWLIRTPFDTWAGPGWPLMGLVGIPHLLAALPVVALPRNPRLGVLAGMLAGVSLLVWISIQWAVLQVFFFLQPVIFVIGVIELSLSLWWRSRLPDV